MFLSVRPLLLTNKLDHLRKNFEDPTSVSGLLASGCVLGYRR